MLKPKQTPSELMTEVAKTALVNYSNEQMFNIVFAVEQYPEFLPWCADSKLISLGGKIMTASLAIDYHGLKQSFVTSNSFEPNLVLEMRLLDGPFKYLEGLWQFIELNSNACKIDFKLNFEFSNFMLQQAAGKTFSQIASTMLDSFVARAKHIYG